jgi:hypothetical protein
LLLCAGLPTLRLCFFFLMIRYFATWHMTSVLSDKLLIVCRCGEAARVHFLHNIYRLLLLVIRARSQGSGCTAVIRLIVHSVF